MKKIKISLFFIFLLTCHLWANGLTKNDQYDTKRNTFNISFSQGIAYGMPSNWRPIDRNMSIQFDTPKIGTQFGVSIGVRLTDINYLNFSYSNQYNGKIVSEKYYDQFFKTWIHLNNFDFYQRRQFLSLKYITKLTTHLEFGAGFSYMFVRRPWVRIRPDYDENENIVGYNLFLYSRQSLRSDDALSITAMVGYFYPINDYVELGLKMGGHLAIVGFESVYLTPFLRVNL